MRSWSPSCQHQSAQQSGGHRHLMCLLFHRSIYDSIRSHLGTCLSSWYWGYSSLNPPSCRCLHADSNPSFPTSSKCDSWLVWWTGQNPAHVSATTPKIWATGLISSSIFIPCSFLFIRASFKTFIYLTSSISPISSLLHYFLFWFSTKIYLEPTLLLLLLPIYHLLLLSLPLISLQCALPSGNASSSNYRLVLRLRLPMLASIPQVLTRHARTWSLSRIRQVSFASRPGLVIKLYCCKTFLQSFILLSTSAAQFSSKCQFYFAPYHSGV